MWVNFTCKSSEANPPVYNYVLLRNETDVGLSEKGTWIEKISRGETFVYGCRAYQQVDYVSSTDNVTVTVNGKIKIYSKQTISFQKILSLTEVELYVSVPPYRFEIQISPLLIFFFVSSLGLMKSAEIPDFHVFFFPATFSFYIYIIFGYFNLWSRV